MVEFKPVTKPNWTAEGTKDEKLGVVIDMINDELNHDPNMSLREFAKYLDGVLMGISHRRMMEKIWSQFGKE